MDSTGKARDKAAPPLGIWLACDEIHSDGADERQHDFRLVRRLAASEMDQAHNAVQLLMDLIDGPYTALTKAIDDFFAERQRVLDRLTSGGRATRTELRERFADILSRFRVFLNRTEADLVRRYGRVSAQRKAFKDAIRTEYDASFAYRLIYNLRNESDHSQEVVGVSQGSGLQPDGTYDLRVTVRVLDRALDTGDWKAAFKKELATAPRPIDATPLLEHVRNAAGRILVRTLLGQITQISAACALVQALAAEAACGPSARIVELAPQGSSRTEMKITDLAQPLSACDALETALRAADRLTWSRWSVPVDDSSFGTELTMRILWHVGATTGDEHPGFTFREGFGASISLSAPTAATAKAFVTEALLAVGLGSVEIGDPTIEELGARQ